MEMGGKQNVIDCCLEIATEHCDGNRHLNLGPDADPGEKTEE